MTANDKTGQKLVDSMRKTKAAAADKAGAQTSRAPAKKATRPQARKKAAARRTANTSRQRRGDPYQSGRRVWPD